MSWARVLSAADTGFAPVKLKKIERITSLAGLKNRLLAFFIECGPMAFSDSTLA